MADENRSRGDKKFEKRFFERLAPYDQFDQREINLSDIDTSMDDITQPYDEEDEKWVQKYSKQPKSSAPAIIVIKSSKPGFKWKIIDGRHRARAAFLRGDKTITAIIPVGSATAEIKEYLVREDSPDHYTVSKWTGGKEPAEVYRVSFNKHQGWDCSCPARGPCKHPEIVKKWMKQGKPEMKPIEAKIFKALHASLEGWDKNHKSFGDNLWASMSPLSSQFEWQLTYGKAGPLLMGWSGVAKSLEGAQGEAEEAAKNCLTKLDGMGVAMSLSSAPGEALAIMKRCNQSDAKPGRLWCIYKHDPKDHSRALNPQPKGWPKTYKTKEDAKKGIMMVHVFSELEPPKNDYMMPPEGTARVLEKNKTYRIQHGQKYNLFQILDIEGDTLKIKDLKRGTNKHVSKTSFQKKLDMGQIHVSAQTVAYPLDAEQIAQRPGHQFTQSPELARREEYSPSDHEGMQRKKSSLRGASLPCGCPSDCECGCKEDGKCPCINENHN